MTPAETAKAIGCSVSHVRHLIRSGKLQARKIATKANQYGYEYRVSQASAKLFTMKMLNGQGWPRGKKRKKK